MPHPTSAWSATALGALILGLLTISACNKARTAPSPPSATVTTRSAELPAATTRTGEIESVPVPGDRHVLTVAGDRPRPIVYLHGMCSEPRSDVQVWASSVSEQGTILALDGDLPCADRGGRTYSQDVDLLDRRIAAAIDAVKSARQIELDASEVMLIGESLGASRAIALASRSPAKYARLVLVGGPETPSAKELDGVKAVALVAGEKEFQGHMRRGASVLEGAGIPARFWELADATHGSYGSDGARTMGEAVGFVASR